MSRVVMELYLERVKVCQEADSYDDVIMSLIIVLIVTDHREIVKDRTPYSPASRQMALITKNRLMPIIFSTTKHRSHPYHRRIIATIR